MAHNIVPINNNVIAPKNICLVLKDSIKNAVIGTITEVIIMYPVIIHCAVPDEILKSSIILDKATFKIVSLKVAINALNTNTAIIPFAFIFFVFSINCSPFFF